MSEPKHTPPPGQETPHPGPWEVRRIGDYPVIYAGETPICHVAIWNEGDARLIAAAPDLLAALKAILTAEMLHETAMGHGDASAVDAANESKWPAVDAAHAAIAKAEGRGAL